MSQPFKSSSATECGEKSDELRKNENNKIK